VTAEVAVILRGVVDKTEVAVAKLGFAETSAQSNWLGLVAG